MEEKIKKEIEIFEGLLEAKSEMEYPKSEWSQGYDEGAKMAYAYALKRLKGLVGDEE